MRIPQLLILKKKKNPHGKYMDATDFDGCLLKKKISQNCFDILFGPLN